MNFFDNIFFLYADPGAGALLLQMLMAVLFGILFFFRRIKDKILSLFGKKSVATADINAKDTGSTDATETIEK